jgi:hypothetical protein
VPVVFDVSVGGTVGDEVTVIFSASNGLGVGLSVTEARHAYSGIAKHVSLSAGHPSPVGHVGLVSQFAVASV